MQQKSNNKSSPFPVPKVWVPFFFSSDGFVIWLFWFPWLIHFLIRLQAQWHRGTMVYFKSLACHVGHHHHPPDPWSLSVPTVPWLLHCHSFSRDNEPQKQDWLCNVCRAIWEFYTPVSKASCSIWSPGGGVWFNPELGLPPPPPLPWSSLLSPGQSSCTSAIPTIPPHQHSLLQL